ncbi:hypothetical protein RHSIM_Rhsim02G0154200 [Rhododendron simsii]|uniref:Uncharacterized protein n=1 Tax=Rhododendron simsii TaxID=118357 RepID=A0A834LSJ1_RHOSS|nr:hypothetical protein RHSIM_Rhsim02G0154200 [Rhododendron simsii]
MSPTFAEDFCSNVLCEDIELPFVMLHLPHGPFLIPLLEASKQLLNSHEKMKLARAPCLKPNHWQRPPLHLTAIYDSKALEYYDLQVRSEAEIQREGSSRQKSHERFPLSFSNTEDEMRQRKPYKGLIRSLQQMGCTHMLDLYCQVNTPIKLLLLFEAIVAVPLLRAAASFPTRLLFRRRQPDQRRGLMILVPWIATQINPNGFDMSGFKKTRQQNLNDAIWKKKSHQVNQYLARWVYEADIPFHAVDNDSFKRFVEVVGQFGPGYRPPSQYQLREPLLKEEEERTKTLLKKQEAKTCFLSSKEDSEASHMGVYIFDYIDKFIEDIGVQNVVQVVTDNASNNMAVADLLKIKRPNIFWTSCATHTINLMLEGIGKQSKFKGIIEKAKAFTISVYAHHNTLAMMRKYTTKRDIVRPGVTRFATAFLTLQSLMEKKQDLRTMFSSDAWGNSKWAKSTKGKAAYATVMTFFPDDINVQDEVINREFLKYKNKDGGFGRPLAARGCGTNDDSYDPVGWWSNYGNHTPNLKRMATRILSLTSSSSGCERNWTTFEGIHTKKRNRLDATRLNNLVYVQFNAKLINNKRKGKDVLRSCEATNAQGWIVGCGDEEVDPVLGLTWEVIGEATGADEVLQPRRSARNVGVRELDEEDFVSEDDSEEEYEADWRARNWDFSLLSMGESTSCLSQDPTKGYFHEHLYRALQEGDFRESLHIEKFKTVGQESMAGRGRGASRQQKFDVMEVRALLRLDREDSGETERKKEIRIWEFTEVGTSGYLWDGNGRTADGRHCIAVLCRHCVCRGKG